MIANMSESELERLSRMWEEHMRAPFPPHMRGREIEGEDMVLLDAETAGCVVSSLSGPLEGKRREILLGCLAAIEKVLPSIDDDGASEYYKHLRDMAALAAELGNTNAR
ncbi:MULTISPECIES: hypothetical protein [unclassified Streptomyces]|uniref:hypothetical protein n=1 Tax=unclassified Streptomyces TaxID=2593676 RepID=UPI00381729E0